MKRFTSAVLPAFLLAVSVGQIYAFTNFSDAIASYISSADEPVSKAQVQFAFSLGIFFLGTGAAFFGKIVERNIRLSTLIGTTFFIAGLLVTELGVVCKSISLIYLGYGFLVGTGTGIIYISPVKTMMLWFYEHKAIAAAVPICGGGMAWNAARMRDVPVWVFHGVDDGVVSVTESITMANALRACGGQVKLTLLPGVTHNAWDPAIREHGAVEWLLTQRRKPN